MMSLGNEGMKKFIEFFCVFKGLGNIVQILSEAAKYIPWGRIAPGCIENRFS